MVLCVAGREKVVDRDTFGDDESQGDRHARDGGTRRADRPGSDGEHVLQARLETVDRADAFYESAMQNALTDRMASFLADRWLGFVATLGDEWPLASPGVDYAGPSTDWYVLTIEEAYIHCAKHVPRLVVDGEAPDDPTAATRRTEHERITPPVEQFVGSRILGFLATADGDGETDLSPRLGPKGFVQVLDDTTLAWPEYRGNGIHASLGNVSERPVASLLFVDWWNAGAVVGVSGETALHDEVAEAVDLTDVDRTKMWVVLDVDSVTVTLDPPLPKLSVEAFDPPWGTDDSDAKKSGFFTA